MTYTPITPFRRPIDAALLAHQHLAKDSLPPEGANKWEVLRELGTAQAHFGVTDRELIVLQALLSFHPETILGGNSPNLIVYPSNVAICERLNGMPGSTMRRHLAGLVDAGLILRRDSPNGKRYVRRYGDERVAFGFDLSPLPRRFPDICAAAELVRAEQDAYRRLRQSVSLMRRDLAGLAAYGTELRPSLPLWELLSNLAAVVSQALRRKLPTIELLDLESKLSAALDQARNIIDPNTEEMNTNDAHTEQHYQNSNKDSYDFELSLEKAKAETGRASHNDEPVPSADGSVTIGTQETVDPPIDKIRSEANDNRNLPNVPLGLVLAVCEELKPYAPDGIRHWHQFVRAAQLVRPMMGVSPSAWDEAVAAMGPEQAAVVIAAMLERFDEIQSPGGYLRHLTRKAELGEFSCGPMVMALLRREAA